ncbi:MAG: DEAD/DEAH box helicase [Paludibacteraceae bacterium]|nr:DEAD/DEAH box helicase [Paludibacteraceae bacterium]
MYFDELDINDDLLDALDIMNFVECTPIQERAIPLVLEGRDILASAQTGTGKTAAYLLPVLELLSRGGSPENKVNALVLVPTRELAQQVDQLLAGFAYYQDTTWIAIYGGNDGVAFAQQQRALEQGGDIAIATPGRLLSLLRHCKVDLSKVDFLILDEADRMLDIGFYDDIMEIISYLPKERQTLMFSATFPTDVEKLARQVLRNPAEVKIAVSKPAEGITQSVYILHEEQKLALVMDMFAKQERGKGIIFASSKEKVRDLYHALRRSGLKVAQIHSDLENAERTQTLLDFKNNKIQLLVATDVVSRGIDIDDIEFVVNYDVPAQPEDYVHRIGRTARAGARGEGITFVTPKDKPRLDKIEKLLEKSIQRGKLPEEVAKLAPEIDESTLVVEEKKKRKFYKHRGVRGKNSPSKQQKYKSNKKNQ